MNRNEIDEILSKVDHTLLARDATWEEIKGIIDDGIRFGTASVCIPPCFVKKAAEYSGGRVAVCTVIGFPNGYNSTAVKVFETKEAVKDGADEIDMVINIGLLKEKKYDELLCEIKAIREACRGKILKVIIETCVLTEDEKVKMCEIVSESGADFIKTSTGFAGGGATREDIALFAENVSPHLKIKAAGGIRSIEDAKDFIALGAERLGTSSIVKIVKNENLGEY
ncbi:MAG: deoxyribose-phosphate aldolase [Clostridia bacterium]|nr:deoxyribose-phosphate aldolase [Clostridia bacterium]